MELVHVCEGHIPHFTCEGALQHKQHTIVSSAQQTCPYGRAFA